MLASWEIQRNDVVKSKYLYLAANISENLPDKALIMLLSLHNAESLTMETGVQGLPIARAQSIAGLNYMYIDENLRKAHGLYALRPFTIPDSAISVRMVLRGWSCKDAAPGQFDLFAALTVDSYLGTILKKFPKGTHLESSADA